ncbi:hypothetical protein SOPP22_16245 [Shewanella sp. OPT22]|nr:hypothetical protein SOPP22_16245 [Shewanella sp. OPT22]
MWQRVSKQMEAYTGVSALQGANLSSLGSKSVKTGCFLKGLEVKRFPDGELKVRQRSIGNFFSKTGFVSMEQVVDCEAKGSCELKKEKAAFKAVLTSRSLPVFIFHKQLEKLDKINSQRTSRQAYDLKISCGQSSSSNELFSIPVNSVDEHGNTPLMEAVCSDGGISACRFLLSSGADVNAKNKRGESALSKAVAHGNIKIVELLLKYEADINHQDGDGFTPLMRAVLSGDIELVDVLQKNGADLNIRNKQGLTALNCAASLGSNKSVKLLLERGAKVTIPDYHGRTALINAAKMGNTDCAEQLINFGAPIDDQDASGKTALHHAVIRNKSESVNLLLNHDAKVNIPDDSGCTALYHAAEYPKRNHFLTHLLRKGANIEGCSRSPIRAAVEAAVDTGNTKALKVLIKRSPNINIHDHLYWQDLMCSSFSAFEQGSDKCLRVLVKCEIDINVKDKNGYTPLLIAAISGNSKAVDFLLKNGADVVVNTPNDKGLTPLYYAAVNDDVKSLQLLLKHGGEIDWQTPDGSTILDHAIARGSAKSVKLLLDKGAKTKKVS